MRTMIRSTRSVSILWIVSSTPILLTDGFFVHRSTSTISNNDISLIYLPMAKNSDRAHIERNLEQMMGDDWRIFRAKLIAQERLDAEAASNTNKKVESINNNGSSTNNVEEKHLGKHSQLSDLFAGAISSIFNSHNNNNDHNANKNKATLPKTERNIFDGDAIGGASYRRHHDFDLCDDKTLSSTTAPNDDPFVSVEELPCHMKPTIVTVNKHRWAHEISHIETGCVLIANEKLGGVFHQTVVLIVQHNKKAGSIGIVINRPMEGTLLNVANQPNSKLDLSLKMAFHNARVTYGGPVLTEEYSILHGYGEVEGSTKLCLGVYVGGSEELMNEVRKGIFDPTKALFVKGHAAWTPKQLQREISKGVWYVAAASSDLILRYAGAPVTSDDNPHDLWSDILTCLGGKYATIAKEHQGRGDLRLP